MFHSSDNLRSNKISDYVKHLKLDTQIVLESGLKFDDFSGVPWRDPG